jgi:hypothetical protein
VVEADDPRLQVEVGGRTVGERLDAAIARGEVLRDAAGRLSLPTATAPGDDVGRKGGFIGRRGETDPFCGFLNGFLFAQAYGEAAVPFGCRRCFKIKVATRSLRALMAMKAIAEATRFTTKSGADVDNPANPHVYGTYLYFDGLDQAREAWRELRAAIDAHPALGPEVVATIKRGCSNYERKCGPSDRYAFDPRLEAAEASLAERFVDDRPPRGASKAAVHALRMLRLVQTAYRIGDETYADFTDGKPLFAPPVSYATDPDGETPASAR